MHRGAAPCVDLRQGSGPGRSPPTLRSSIQNRSSGGYGSCRRAGIARSTQGGRLPRPQEWQASEAAWRAVSQRLAHQRQGFLALVGGVQGVALVNRGCRTEQALLDTFQRLVSDGLGTEDFAEVLMDRGRIVDDQNASVCMFRALAHDPDPSACNNMEGCIRIPFRNG